MNLQELPRLVDAAVAARAAHALASFGAAWAAASAAEAPVRTGRLRASLRWDDRGPTAGALLAVGYGRFVETGHRTRSLSGRRVPPNPFLRRGAAQVTVPADDAVRQTLVQAARRALDGLG